MAGLYPRQSYILSVRVAWTVRNILSFLVTYRYAPDYLSCSEKFTVMCWIYLREFLDSIQRLLADSIRFYPTLINARWWRKRSILWCSSAHDECTDLTLQLAKVKASATASLNYSLVGNLIKSTWLYVIKYVLLAFERSVWTSLSYVVFTEILKFDFSYLLEKTKVKGIIMPWIKGDPKHMKLMLLFWSPCFY